MEEGADEADFLELVVASERVQGWLDVLSEPRCCTARAQQVVDELYTAVSSRPAYLEEVRTGRYGGHVGWSGWCWLIPNFGRQEDCVPGEEMWMDGEAPRPARMGWEETPDCRTRRDIVTDHADMSVARDALPGPGWRCIQSIDGAAETRR